VPASKPKIKLPEEASIGKRPPEHKLVRNDSRVQTLDHFVWREKNLKERNQAAVIEVEVEKQCHSEDKPRRLGESGHSMDSHHLTE
jgi:hypothetical protein